VNTGFFNSLIELFSESLYLTFKQTEVDSLHLPFPGKREGYSKQSNQAKEG